MRVLPVLRLALPAVLVTACATPESDPAAGYEVVAVTDEEGASLGSVALPVACAPQATPHLRRGLALLHNMTYTEAETAFATAASVDPECALAYWGQAMSLVHPLWPDVPSAEGIARGADLLAEARAHGPLDERTGAWVAALEAYYQDASARGEPARLADFAAGWEAASAADPGDLEAKLFRALGAIAVAGAADDRVQSQAEAGGLAEEVLAVVPDHTGALHYIIHAYDLPELAERALPAARTYGEVAPDNAHALHMTSHIFTRVGSWEESSEYNRRAAAAGLAHPIAGATSHHYLHAADYLVYARLQRHDDVGAHRVWVEMRARADRVTPHPASAYAFAAVPARLALERGNWRGAASIERRWPPSLPWDRMPHLEAITEFARGIGAARSGDVPAAAVSAARLDALRVAAGELPGAYDWGTQVEIQGTAVRAWIALADDRTGEALGLMRAAAELEGTTRKNPVTPGEVLPAAELLGDMLIELGRFAEARAAYGSALERTRRRANSLFGAARAAELDGDADAARRLYGELLESAVPEARDDHLAHARQVLAGG